MAFDFGLKNIGIAIGQEITFTSQTFYSVSANNGKPILDELDTDKIRNNNIINLLYLLCSDKDGNSFRDLDDDFNLYISIAKNANNSLPKETIEHKLFKKYRVPKKKFPLKSYYHL